MAKKKKKKLYTVTVDTSTDYHVEASSRAEAEQLAAQGKGMELCGTCKATAKVINERDK